MHRVLCRLDPIGEFFYDGSTLNPFEVMFVPMNSMIVENNWSFARQASLYQKWLNEQVRPLDTAEVHSLIRGLSVCRWSHAADELGVQQGSLVT